MRDYARPLKRWRADWPASYHLLLANLREKWPEGRGVKEFVAILRLHEQAPASLVEQAIEQALAFGSTHLDGVKLCLQQLQAPVAAVAPLDLAHQPELAAVGLQPVDLTCYDQLIERERAS